jgi:hypothetical protein
MSSNNYNIRWQAKIDEKLKHIEEVIQNHIVSRLDKLNARMWKLIFTLLMILGGLSVALITALFKITP